MPTATSGIAGLVGSIAGGEVANAWGYPAALAMGASAVALGLMIFVIRVVPAIRRAPA
jgi:predicted MFS family arabinose efflux permease